MAFECPACGPASGAPLRVRRLPAGFTVISCRRCTVEWQWPRPTERDRQQLYSQQYYDAWGLQEDSDLVRRTKRSTFDRLLARVERYVTPGRLLDVGCATGFLLEAAQRRGWEPYGAELSAYASAVAQQRFGRDRVMNARLEDTSFADRSFRALTMTDLIEHVLDPVGTLHAARRLLEPEGVLCISTPQVGCLSYYLMGKRWTQYKREHLQYYRPDAITALLAGLGFEVVERRTWPKTVTLEYVQFQFERYRHWLLSPAVRVVHAILPPALRTRPLSVPLGDMLVIARRRD